MILRLLEWVAEASRNITLNHIVYLIIKSEKIEALKLENVCRLRPRSKQSGYQVMLLKKDEENIAAQLDKLKKNVSRHWLRWNEVEDLLMAQYPEQYNSFISSPLFSEADQSDGGFQSVSGFSENLLSFWTKGDQFNIIFL